MQTRKAAGLVTAAAVGLGVYAAPAPAPAASGCRINIAVKNTGTHWIRAYNDDTDHTGVKVRGGVWRGLRYGKWFESEHSFQMAPDATKADGYSATFSCSAKRRYRVRYGCNGGGNTGSEFTAYYPSPTGWTDGYDGSTITIELPMCK